MTEIHSMLTDELRDAAALYAMGMLDLGEAQAYSAHLEQCTVCREEVRAVGDAAAEACLDAPPADPPAGLRERVLKELKPREYRVARGQDSPWKPFGVPGIEIKTLLEDPVAGTRSFLLRMAPGAVLPAHDHVHSEHCYVVEGHVFDHDHSISAGDYELRLPGSVHSAVRTLNGATLLIIAGRHEL